MVIKYASSVYNLQIKLMIVQPAKWLSPWERAERLGLDSAAFEEFTMSLATADAVDRIKKSDRSNLKLADWKRKGYHKSNAIQQMFDCPDDVQRRDVETLSKEEFTERYERQSKPVIIRGCTKDWPASQQWTHQRLLEKYSRAKFKVGEDDDGYKLRLPFMQYMEYLVYNEDDSPLYLFESELQDQAETKPILDDYRIPPYFGDDLFHLAGEERRPPYRWFIMGPERSGTPIHIDPLMTSAWNASLKGHKRWVLFGENVPKSIVKGKEFRPKGYDDEAINYFVEILPKIKAKYSTQTLQMIQFIQYPGETVFVPGGLWHAVINLDDTIAVTQNVMTQYCFDKVWRATRSQRRKFAESFLSCLQEKSQELYQRALQLNTEDNFSMGNKYCQQEVSLSFTPSSSSSSSSSAPSPHFSKEESPKNRVNVHHRLSNPSSRSNSPNRSRQKPPRTTFSTEKKQISRRSASLS